MFPQGRRALAGLALAATSALLVSSCTGTSPDPAPVPSGSPTPGPTSESPAPPTETVSLRFGVSGTKVLRAAYEKLARAYMNENPDVSIEVERLPAGDEPLAERLGLDPPDVFVATNEEAPALVRGGLVQPVDELLGARGVEFGDGYQRLGLEAFSAEQALQCMPYDVSPLVVFYNPGLISFRRLIEPGDEPLSADSGWKWEQFAKAARLMSRDGVKGLYVEPDLDILMALSRSAGVDVVDDPREASTLTLSEEPTREVLEEILAVVRDPRLTPEPGDEDADMVRRFAREKIGMIIGTKALVPQLRRQAEFDFDVFPLPRLARSRSVADVTGYCLSSTTAETDAAADFLAFATADRGAAILAETGAVVPAHLPTLNSLAFTQPGSSPSSVLVFDEAVEKSSVVPFNPRWPDLRTVVQPDLRALFTEPVINLEVILPRIDTESRAVLSPDQPEDSQPVE